MQKILYVEDNDDNVYVMKGRLPRLEFEVVVAVNGEQGVAMAETEAPDLILMDLRLPGIDGWEATRRIKAAHATKDIPVIALSAHAMAGDREKAIEAGCDDYDTKPVDFPKLLERIRTVLARVGKPSAGGRRCSSRFRSSCCWVPWRRQGTCDTPFSSA